ncbi:hypothetical protein HELRODRAFT_184823 [Helobdella robusta]|uniref:Peptidyl-prolyl cis-trans isomerase n=1 Tax=Helobdella robusta TaxID=6412 RepID=T1FM19_HELRO|nr:hypothetical protein HELRODRAFT_184823 [Helobdella robusta]ESO12423.1 hypothetical protein HELRODRAFT_184823 [Helobdella robusta]
MMMNKIVLISLFLPTAFQLTWASCNNSLITQKAYFDVAIGNEYWGRIVVGLLGDTTPITVLNFATFASNHNNKGYSGTIFNRVYTNMAIQGGDILFNNGSGSTSIFNGGEDFPDENFYFSNDRGFIGMANRGANTNGCQFFINLAQNTFLNNIYVVFGKVLSGLDVVDKIASLPLDDKGVPLVPATIVGSGTFHPKEPFPVPIGTYF